MNIYSCVDSDNIDKIFVLYYSIFLNCDDFLKYKFFLLTDRTDIDVPYFLKKQLKIKKFEIDDRWKEVISDFNEHFYKKCDWCRSDFNFSRFFIFEHFPEIDRAIYLDWDMVLNCNIGELEKFYNKTDKMIVARQVNNKNIEKNIFTSRKTEVIEQLYGDVLNKPSYNSGFYIVSKDMFNMDKLYSFIKDLIKIQKEHNMFTFGTQVVMNLYTIDMNYFIDSSWNTIQKNNDTKIIHWCGGKKPWLTKDKIWMSYFNKLMNS